VIDEVGESVERREERLRVEADEDDVIFFFGSR
jgi:hypothetical protein